MNTALKPKVLVAGRNASSNLCMARSLGLAGYEVEVLRIIGSKPRFANLMRLLKPEVHSKYVRNFHSCICGGDNGRIAETLLSLAVPGEKMVYLPTCDMSASAADEYLDQLRDSYYLPNMAGKAGAITNLMSKDVQSALAKEAGLPVINSCVIRAKDGIFTIPDSVNYPCFIKPNISKNSIKSHIRRCDSQEDLAASLTSFSHGREIEMLVADYVEIRQEYGLLGLSTKGGALCPCFFAKEEIGSEDRKGVTMVGKIMPSEFNQELRQNIARFVQSLEYEGLFDLDIVEDVNGTWYIVELNLRYGASGWALTECGLNLPAMYADYLVRRTPIDTALRMEHPGKRFVSDKILLDEYARDLLTMGQVRRLMDTTDIHFIENRDDPKPYWHFRKFYLFGTATRLLFRLKKALKR